MRIFGTYRDELFNSKSPDLCSVRMDYRSQIALEISSAWTEAYSSREDETAFEVKIRSGCYSFRIKTKNDEYFSKEIADELVKKIATSDIVILDDYDMALFAAADTTPDMYPVINAYDEDLNEIPLTVTKTE